MLVSEYLFMIEWKKMSADATWNYAPGINCVRLEIS